MGFPAVLVIATGMLHIISGVRAVFDPNGKYGRVGIISITPKEERSEVKMGLMDEENLNDQISGRRLSDNKVAISAPMFMLGIRDMSLGLSIKVCQITGNTVALVILFTTTYFMKMGDGVLVLATGDKKTKSRKTAEHFLVAIYFLALAVYFGTTIESIFCGYYGSDISRDKATADPTCA